MEINVEITGFERVQDLLDAYPERAVRASVWAINRTARGLQSEGAKLITKTFNVTQREVKKVLYTKLANARRIYANVNFEHGKISLEHFKPRPNEPGKKKSPKGVRVTIRRGKPAYYKHAFILESKNPETQAIGIETPKIAIYSRQGKERGPLYHIYGPSISQMISPEDAETLKLPAIERFKMNFIHQMEEGYKHVKRRKW